MQADMTTQDLMPRYINGPGLAVTAALGVVYAAALYLIVANLGIDLVALGVSFLAIVATGGAAHMTMFKWWSARR